jgi:transcriptional regulator with XRE-family HTH domain/tetratricopeptide (TPR) repeat protein
MGTHRTIDRDVVDAFAHALKGARESRRLTQETFAELCNLSVETLQRYERPSYGGHSLATIRRLLVGFDGAAKQGTTPQSHPLTYTERAPMDATMRALGSHRGVIEGIYATQKEAYESLAGYLRERFEERGPCVRSAVLVQTSGTSAMQLLTTILDCIVEETMEVGAEVPVVMYTADARVLASLGSSQQEKRIRALQDELPNALQERFPYLVVRAYRTPPSLSAVHIELADDAPILLMGFIAYTQNVRRGDYLELSARNRAAIVARGSTPNYERLYPTLQAVLTNLREVARPQGTAWYGEDMPPATVAHYRLRSLLRADYSVEDVAFLGLWAGLDLGSLINLLEATCTYYEVDGHQDEEMVAYLNLVLGLAYRELAVETDSRPDYERAAESLNRSLEFWTKKPDAALARAYCYDRLGTVTHLLGDHDRAAQWFEDAEDWARRARGGDNEMPARLVQAWAQLNHAMLELDRGRLEAAREYLASSLDAFERASEHGALLTCVAASACYAEARGHHVAALQLIASLSGEGTRRLSPTYWHRWVVKALKSSRRAINDHHAAIEAETQGESWTLADSLHEARKLIADVPLFPELP